MRLRGCQPPEPRRALDWPAYSAGLTGLNEGQVVEYEEVPNKGKTSAEHLKLER